MRDPKLNPKPGDVLRGKRSTRCVGRSDDHYVGFTYWPLGREHGKGNGTLASLSWWRVWAKDAEVVEVAE